MILHWESVPGDTNQLPTNAGWTISRLVRTFSREAWKFFNQMPNKCLQRQQFIKDFIPVPMLFSYFHLKKYILKTNLPNALPPRIRVIWHRITCLTILYIFHNFINRESSIGVGIICFINKKQSIQFEVQTTHTINSLRVRLKHHVAVIAGILIYPRP